MITAVTSAMLAIGVSMNAAAVDITEPHYEDMGVYRISVYCERCNEEVGYQSASGTRLDYGQVAMNEVPFGTVINIDGEEFVVTDRVGVDNTVDIFIPSEDGRCHCNWLEYRHVYRKEE